MDIYGVDFSGAAAAGEKTWLAEARLEADDDGPDGLHVERCRSLADLAGTAERGPALAELVERLQRADAAGLDFSFGLPVAVHDAEYWPEFLRWFPGEFDGPEDMQAVCSERVEYRTDGERTFVDRTTDEQVGASSPYHWLVAHQTFYGIRDVLGPLVTDGAAVVAPMQGRDGETEVDDRPTLCEVYPAATLRSLDLPSERYKDASAADREEYRERRERILDGLPEMLTLSESVRDAALDDEGGDALDAVLAASATCRASRDGFDPDREYHPVEGYIYV
ncbi:DUF429 domain-containing protein [Halomarina oriensis]|uniref:DUF429 domain-containing protein n=1 Tax=Halomarina oriensis TaxID=671145 RepID=A0A6B0GKZ0_9EURY|nr:DUF429 domain-containing protein [Halomarina oriensis]MWG35414.1 DUF429 domain-containing protein [Halomarina oriensis]